MIAAARFAGNALICGGTDPGRRNLANPPTCALDGGSGLSPAGHHLPRGRAAGTLAGRPFAKARGPTIRRDLIAVAVCTARHGRGYITLHLPEGWHREQAWLNLWDATCGPPAGRRLISPNRVSTLDGPRGDPERRPRARNPGQAAQRASGRALAPAISSRNSSAFREEILFIRNGTWHYGPA